MKFYKIAIDGPAGVGKSTLAKEVAKRLSFLYIDSGAMYRAVGLYCFENGIDVSDHAKVGEILPNIHIDMKNQDGNAIVFLNGQDVSKEIRTTNISAYASKVGVIPAVRKRLVGIQQELSRGKNVLMDGRDIGTKVFPDADVKIFLTAACEERARRRVEQNALKGDFTPYEEILAEIKFRDENDSTRVVDPLRPAEDAVIVDNTNFVFEQTITRVMEIIKEVIA